MRADRALSTLKNFSPSSKALSFAVVLVASVGSFAACTNAGDEFGEANYDLSQATGDRPCADAYINKNDPSVKTVRTFGCSIRQYRK